MENSNLHPSSNPTPPKKKRNWSSSQCCTSLLESLERRSHWAAARALWKCRSRCPDFRCTERSTGLITSSWEAFTQAPIPIPCEQNQATTATLLPNTGARKLLWVSSCYTPRRLQSLFRFKVQSACHILLQDLIFFYPYHIASSVIRKTQHSNHHRRPLGQSSFLMLSKASNSSANSPGDLNLLQRTGLCRDNSCIIFSGKTRASAHMYLEEKCSTNCWPEGFWNAWVNPTMVRYMTYVIYIYIYIYSLHMHRYHTSVSCCFDLESQSQKFPRVNQKFFRRELKKVMTGCCLGLLGISGTLDLFPRMQVTPLRKRLYTFLVRESHT